MGFETGMVIGDVLVCPALPAGLTEQVHEFEQDVLHEPHLLYERFQGEQRHTQVGPLRS
jgi:hypothetical protein